MPAFRIYNIQLLALDTTKTKEVGIEGYKRLFELLNKSVQNHIENKKVIEFSDSLIHDTYISPFTIHSEKNSKYSYGEFVRFHKADNVLDIYTKATLYTADAAAAAVSNLYLFRFVFDHVTHRLAIEEQGGKLPDPMRFRKTLEYFLKPIADEYFKDHTFTVNLVSDEKQLRQVLSEADGFSKVSVVLTFPNGPALNKTLQELKKNNVHRVALSTSSERGAVMPSLTGYMKALLENAPKYGEAAITYYKNIKKTANEKWARYTYKTKDFPKKFTLRQGIDETDEIFIDRVWFKLTNTFNKRKIDSKE